MGLHAIPQRCIRLAAATIACVLGLAAARPAAAPPAQAPAAIDAVAWLAGCWVMARPDGRMEEHWLAPAGGAMLGLNRTIRNGRMTAHEFLRIDTVGGRLAYIAKPSGQAETAFPATSITATEAVFENPAHDFPQRIAYRLGADGVLTSRVDRAANDPARGFDLRFERCPAAAAPAPVRPGHTAADVRFMQGMIAHHAQAVEMAALVGDRTPRQDLRLLALRIDVSQRDEIRSMRQWLLDRCEAAPDEHAHHAPGAPRMPGMLAPDEMAALRAATGPAFERLFLEGMIRHHEGALVMVAELLASPGAAQDADLFDFASHVEADQRMEIARMRALLRITP